MASYSAKPNKARIFVGADRSQLLAVKVLEHSIRRHTDLEVAVRSMHDLDLPDPVDIRQGKRTGFSFTRFAIPQLADYVGRALYLDADMLVFRDLRELYELPFDGAKVLIQEELPSETVTDQKRIKQCSVMLLDCDRLDWKAEEIIAGLDGKYTYEDLMFHLCILEPDEVGYKVPFAWNSLEAYEPGTTGLIHYTDMNTQPWVSVDNPNGYLWLNEVRLMLDAGAMRLAEVEQEIALGYFRPSLLAELELGPQREPTSPSERARLKRIDADAGFVAHREVMEQRRRRQAAIKAFEAARAEGEPRSGAASVTANGGGLAAAGWGARMVGALRRLAAR